MMAKRAPQIVVQLIHIAGPMKGEIQVFTEGVITIGRHPSCSLRLPADLTSVSRQHAEIVREGNQFRLTDHSTNGTFVNGKRATETFLKNGDVLAFSELGPKVSFLAEIREGGLELEVTPSPKPPGPIRTAPLAATQEQAPRQPPVESRPATGEPPPIAQTIRVPLIIQYGPTLRSFRELPVTIGKSSQCHLALDHPALAAQHMQILYAQDRYWVKDLTGLQSVRVNRKAIGDQAPLEVNDELAMSPQGPYFRFLGGGRLAEIPEPTREEPAPSGRGEEKAPAPEGVEGKPRKGLFSRMRKIVDR
jgi:pSer/pThr/pTyr-binding forkhead associated (FHA) protein